MSDKLNKELALREFKELLTSSVTTTIKHHGDSKIISEYTIDFFLCKQSIETIINLLESKTHQTK